MHPSSITGSDPAIDAAASLARNAARAATCSLQPNTAKIRVLAQVRELVKQRANSPLFECLAGHELTLQIDPIESARIADVVTTPAWAVIEAIIGVDVHI